MSRIPRVYIPQDQYGDYDTGGKPLRYQGGLVSQLRQTSPDFQPVADGRVNFLRSVVMNNLQQRQQRDEAVAKNQAFNDWYGKQTPDQLSQFRDPSAGYAHARIVTTDPIVKDSLGLPAWKMMTDDRPNPGISKENARNYFNNSASLGGSVQPKYASDTQSFQNRLNNFDQAGSTLANGAGYYSPQVQAQALRNQATLDTNTSREGIAAGNNATALAKTRLENYQKNLAGLGSGVRTIATNIINNAGRVAGNFATAYGGVRRAEITAQGGVDRAGVTAQGGVDRAGVTAQGGIDKTRITTQSQQDIANANRTQRQPLVDAQTQNQTAQAQHNDALTKAILDPNAVQSYDKYTASMGVLNYTNEKLGKPLIPILSPDEFKKKHDEAHPAQTQPRGGVPTSQPAGTSTQAAGTQPAGGTTTMPAFTEAAATQQSTSKSGRPMFQHSDGQWYYTQ